MKSAKNLEKCFKQLEHPETIKANQLSKKGGRQKFAFLIFSPKIKLAHTCNKQKLDFQKTDGGLAEILFSYFF